MGRKTGKKMYRDIVEIQLARLFEVYFNTPRGKPLAGGNPRDTAMNVDARENLYKNLGKMNTPALQSLHVILKQIQVR